MKNGWRRITAVRGWAFALPLLAVMRLLRPLVLTRLHPLADRLGHFAANTELYLCERDAGIGRPRTRHVDLAFNSTGVVPNEQLATMWRRVIRVWPSWLLKPIYELNSIFPGGEGHEVGPNAQEDRDVLDLLATSAPHLSFTKDEQARGEAGLRALGIPLGAELVCLIARDEAYHRTLVPGAHFDYHSFRNVTIANYVLAAEALADLGFYVLRMGAVVKDPLESNHPRVVDYATSGLRDDFMDVYLGANCTFCLSCGVGFDGIAYSFRRPIAYLNIVPLGYLPTYYRDAILLCKHHRRVGQAMLSISEIVHLDVADCLTSGCYADSGIQLVENTPEELRDAALEMAHRVRGTWRDEPGDEALQRRFWDLFPLGLRDAFRHEPLHGTVRARYSAHFLRANQSWLQ